MNMNYKSAKQKASILMLLVCLLLCYQNTMAQVQMPETIVYGTVYNIFHDEYATDKDFFKAVDQDMANINKANFNLVMPFPFGQWDAKTKTQSWKRTDYLVDQLEENQLNLMPIMLKSTHRAYLPTWKWVEMDDAIREFPEVGRSSEEVKYMHPEVMHSIEDYFESIANRYGNRKSLVGYNLWNEAHYNSIDEITIPKFRQWLQSKYGDLQTLNRVWAEDYGDWNQITPLMSRNWESSMAAIDWDLFRYANNGDIAKWARSTIRKYDKKHFVTINTVGTVENNTDYSQWTVDGRQISLYTDIWGISFYPDKYMNRTQEPMPYWKYSCMYDVTRADAGDKPYFLVEAQTNQQNGMGLFQFMSYDDIHLMSWIALADNCKGIVFWKWDPFYRGQQAFGRGLTLANGELAPRGEAAKDVGAVLKEHGKMLYEASLNQSEAGILYDIVALQKSQEAVGRPGSAGKMNYFMQESFEGTYKALFDANIQVDIIRTDMPLSWETLKKYKVLYAPYQLVIRKEVSELLKRFVKEGGVLVADAHSFVMDEFDFGFPINPGYGLDTLFGGRRLDIYSASTAFSISGSIAGDQHEYEGLYYQELLEPIANGEVVASFDDVQTPALIKNRSNKGSAYLSATSLGGSYYNGHDGAGKVLVSIAREAGVKSVATVNGQNKTHLMIREHTHKEGRLLYVMNLSNETFEGDLEISNSGNRAKSIKELISGEEVVFKSKGDGISINTSISPRRTTLFLIK